MPKQANQTNQAQKANPPQNQASKDEVLQNLQHLPSQAQTKTIARNTIAEQNEMLKHKDFWQQYENGDIVFLDKSGKKHILESEVQDKWLETFGLESITQDFAPKIPSKISEKIGKEIILGTSDLYKIVATNREKYISEIKATFENPQAVFFDEMGDLIFAKTLDDKLFFVNVSRDYGDSFKGLSLASKKNNNLFNKLEKAKEVIFNDLASKPRGSTAQQAFTGFLSATNKASNEIIQKISQKFNKDEKFAKNLYEWHKDSHPITKEADGTPKVFYHGSNTKFDVFKPNPKSYGIWVTDDIDEARPYYKRGEQQNHLYSVFIKVKKLYGEDIKDFDKIKLVEPYTEKTQKVYEKLKKLGYDGLTLKNKIIVFDSNQIKAVGNKGTFDSTNPNIYHSSSTAGGGVLGGSIAGVER